MNDTMKSAGFKLVRHATTMGRRLDARRLANLAWMMRDIKQRRTRVRSLPAVVRINPTPVCNLRCRGCRGRSYRSPNESPVVMSLPVFRRIVEQVAPTACLAVLYDEGEPLLHPRIVDMVRIADAANLSTSISSNLSFEMSDEQVDRLVTSGLDRLIVALDGMTQATYARYRVGGDVERVKTNFERIVRARRRLGRSRPQVEVQFLQFGYNEPEREATRRYVLEVGADRFRPFPARFDGFYFNDLDPEARRRLGCTHLWASLHVNNDGRVYPCDYGEDHGLPPLGSLQDRDLPELWNCTAMQDLRRGFRRWGGGLASAPCRQCPPFEGLPRLLR